MKWIIFVPYTGIGLMQAVSFTLLGSGVLRIRRLIVQNDSSEINNKKLLLHIICFALYLLTLCFLFYRTIYNIFAQVNDINNTIYWATLSQVVFFVMMTALLAILYSLGEKAQIDYSDSSSRVSTIQQQSPQSQRAGRLSMQKRLIERHELTATDLNSTLDVQEVEEDDRIINQFLLVRNKQHNSQTAQVDSSLHQFAY
jgi:predicted membrane protein